MKRFLPMLMALLCLAMLVACQTDDNVVSDDDGRDLLNPYFTGKVLEVYEKGCLLEVTDIGNGNFWIGNKVMVHTDISNSPAYDVGDFLRISFDGKVAESYPPQVTTVFIVSKTDSKGKCVE